jgi:hypothetical protein
VGATIAHISEIRPTAKVIDTMKDNIVTEMPSMIRPNVFMSDSFRQRLNFTNDPNLERMRKAAEAKVLDYEDTSTVWIMVIVLYLLSCFWLWGADECTRCERTGRAQQ